MAAAVPANHGRPDRAGDVVISGRDICHKRTERIERRRMAEFHFLLDRLSLNLVQLHVAGAFNQWSAHQTSSNGGQLAESFQFGKLGFIAGIGQATGRRPSRAKS